MNFTAEEIENDIRNKTLPGFKGVKIGDSMKDLRKKLKREPIEEEDHGGGYISFDSPDKRIEFYYGSGVYQLIGYYNPLIWKEFKFYNLGKTKLDYDTFLYMNRDYPEFTIVELYKNRWAY